MKRVQKFCAVILIITAAIAAIGLRVPKLAQRPMHTDEAVHAVKFGELLEKGEYRYNPNEYHGPTLNYFTLIPAKLLGINTFKDVDEFTLRIVPVFFGVAMVVMVLLLIKGMGVSAVIAAMILTAVSPAMVFYSRYYIQEMLLVCFTFGAIVCGYRYIKAKSILWALTAGVFFGLMHATKETSIIAFGSMGVAVLLTILTGRREDTSGDVKKIKLLHTAACVLAAAAVSILFYSSFFTNMGGVFDSLRAYTTYFGRAGENQFHIHPWYYYLDILVFWNGSEKLWNEEIIVILAVIGFLAAFNRKLKWPDNSLVRFLAFYTFIMLVVYSAIPYKTPWSMLGFLHGMILLAGVGAAVLIKFAATFWSKVVLVIILTGGGLSLIVQAYLGSFVYYTSPSNPYVYAHPTGDVIAAAHQVEEIAEVNPAGHNMYIEVIFPEGDYWPLPWYLRSFSRVGWWSSVDLNKLPAEVIIASPKVEGDVLRMLYEVQPAGKRELYVPMFEGYMELRPGAEMRGYVAKELWNRLAEHRSKLPQTTTGAPR